MTSHQQLALEYSRLLGEYRGMLKGVCTWDIPAELKSKLKSKIKELGRIKTPVR